jgi:hypothetical protein
MILGQLSVSTPFVTGPPADSEIIQVEFWALPRTGTPFVLHEVGDFEVADIAGSRGTVSLSVPLRSSTHDLLYANTVLLDADLEIEIRLFGGQAQSLRGYLQECDGDDAADTGTRTWSGCLTAGLTDESVLYPRDDDPKGETHFAGKNAGQIVDTLVAIAQGRGELSGVTTATFSGGYDSLGNPWPTSTTITLSPGSLLSELLEEFEELGLCEWFMTAQKELLLFVPGARGIDHTIGQSGVPSVGFGTQPFGTSPFGGVAATAGADLVVMHRGRDLFDAPRKWSVRGSVTTLLTSGKEGLYQTATDASAQARRGRKIVGYASAGQVEDAGALQAFAQNQLATLSPGQTELAHGLVVNGDGPKPFLDVNVGDWVWTDTGSLAGPERLRVQQVSISRSGDDLQSTAVVGTLSQSAIVALKRKLARLQRGTTVVGTSVDPTAPGGGEDVIPPAAPTGLVASSIAYQDSGGETLARIDLGWQAVTTDAREAVSAQAQAAQLILDRIESGATILDDWTWHGCPQLVADHNDALLAEFAVDVPDYEFPDDLPQARTWLQDYINTAEQAVSDPVVTDDVAGYRVRYAYVGLNQVGGIPSSDPFLDQDTLAYYMATDETGTTATSYSWGGVGAGVEVRLQVQAFDRSGNSSVWSSPLVITTAVDNLPPAAPSVPLTSAWFGTVRIAWDGLTVDGLDMRAAAPDFAYVEVHLSQALDFTPDATTLQARIAAAGVWTVTDLSYGVGYFARLVAVDTAGNASLPSATGGPVIPSQLVNIDIGPDAITRVQIVDGEIVTAKIADLAVNDAKIASMSVGKLVTGVLIADVTLSGIIRTALTGARTEIDAAGLRLYNAANTKTVDLDATTGNATITGTYKSAPDGTGERINILPDGTFRLFPVAGSNYSQIANFGNDVVWRGPMDPNGRSGRFNVNVLGCGMNYSNEQEIPNQLQAEVAVFERRTQITAPNMFFRVNARLSPITGFPGYRAATFAFTQSDGNTMLGGSAVHYRMGTSGSGGWSNNGAGLKFEGNFVIVTDETLNSFGQIKASVFAPPSSRTLKEHIVDLDVALDGRAVDVVRRLRPVEFNYRAGIELGQPRHLGLIVEDVTEVAPTLVVGRDQPVGEQALSVMGLATLAAAAAADNADDIAAIKRHLGID